jgi:multidrug resistance efflux pump
MSKYCSALCVLGLLLLVLAPLRAKDKLPEPAVGEQAEVVLESKGYVVPVTTVTVAPRVSGQIIQLFFEEGMRVEKGALLARIDPTPFEIDYKRAQAQVSLASARLEELKAGSREEEKILADVAVRQAKERLNHAKMQLERMRTLKANAAVSAEDVNTVESRVREAELEVAKQEALSQMVKSGPRRERVEAAKAELGVAEAQRDKAKYRLAGAEVRAPLTGTVMAKHVEAGIVLDLRSYHLRSTVCEIADLTQLEVELHIQERDLPRVFRGQKCDIRLEAFPGIVYNGQVSRMMPAGDRAKGAVPVRVRIDVPKDDSQLRPEMGAVVSLMSKK